MKSENEKQAEYGEQTAKSYNKLCQVLREQLSDHFQFETTVMGGLVICVGTDGPTILKVYAHRNKFTVHRFYDSSDILLDCKDFNLVVSTIVTHLESRIDELNDIATVPKNKPVLVLIERGERKERLFRVGYYYDNVELVGDTFAFDRVVLGWLPIAGIKY